MSATKFHEKRNHIIIGKEIAMKTYSLFGKQRKLISECEG